jgi:hypothetical protein
VTVLPKFSLQPASHEKTSWIWPLYEEKNSIVISATTAWPIAKRPASLAVPVLPDPAGEGAVLLLVPLLLVPLGEGEEGPELAAYTDAQQVSSVAEGVLVWGTFVEYSPAMLGADSA